MGQHRIYVKGVKKLLHSFMFPRPERHYTKALNLYIYICDVKYLHTTVHAQAAWFLKIQDFLKLKIFFVREPLI